MSDPETALCCMIVSNPTGGERPHAWQKRVNDHMRAQAAEIARLTAERDELAGALDAEEMKHGITSNGNMWRYWRKLAQDTLDHAKEEKRIIIAERDAAEAQVADAYARGLRDAAGACDAEMEAARQFGPHHVPIISSVKQRITALIPKPATEG